MVGRVGRVEIGLLISLVAVMVVVSASAATLEIRRAHDAAEQRDEVLLTQALSKASAVSDVLRTTSTAQALVDPDGSLGERSFRAYAIALVAQPGITSVAYEVRVDDADREEFERTTGIEITERSPAGDLVRASTRPVYFPVTYAWPPALRSVTGFDVISAPMRSAAFELALATGEPALSGPVNLALGDELGVFVLVPLVSSTGAELVGLITVGYLTQDVENEVLEGFPDGAALRIADDGQNLVDVGDTDADMATGTVDVGGRTWEVAVRHPQRASIASGLWMGVAGSLFALLVGAVGWILLRQRRDVEAARTRLLGLQTATAAFARTSDAAAIRSIAVARCATMMGGTATWVSVVGGEFRVVATAGRARGADPTLLGRDALLFDEGSDDQPSSTPREIPSSDGTSAWVFPVSVSSRTREAVVVVVIHGGHATEANVEVCASVLVVAAAALRRAAAQEREHHVAVTLQDQLLAPAALPALDGLELAAIYRPASGERFIGGDWYDVAVVNPHRIVVSVGDVVGHGVQAAGAMGMLRTASRTLAGLMSPAGILEQLDRVADDTSSAFMATALVVEFQLDTMTLRYASAGHPPPFMLRDGTSEQLLEGGGAPLGLPPPGSRSETVRPIRAGDRLLFYTDGLIEQRRADIDKSLDELAAAAMASRTSDSASACRKIIDEVVGPSPNDDIVLLIATLTDAFQPVSGDVGERDTSAPAVEPDEEFPVT